MDSSEPHEHGASSQPEPVTPASETPGAAGGQPSAAANQEIEDRAKALTDKLDEGYPEAWIPEQPGDMMVGIFKRLESAQTTRGLRHIVVLGSPRNLDFEKAIWLHHTALRNQFRQAAPAAGEMVAVRWEGKKTSESTGQEYDGWTVRVDRPQTDAEVDWSEVPIDDSTTGGAPLPEQATSSPGPSPPPVVESQTPPAHDPGDDIPF